MSENHLSDLTFSSLDLVPDLMRGIEEAGFTRCTPIQAQTLPFALAGRDVAGQAQTGTGKTAAFLVGLFQNLLKHPRSTYSWSHGDPRIDHRTDPRTRHPDPPGRDPARSAHRAANRCGLWWCRLREAASRS